MKYARIVRGDQVAFAADDRVLRVPSVAACRERLIQLLEEAGGNLLDERVKTFWLERVRDIATTDELQSAWAEEVFMRLEEIWAELTTPPKPLQESSDVFAEFGL